MKTPTIRGMILLGAAALVAGCSESADPPTADVTRTPPVAAQPSADPSPMSLISQLGGLTRVSQLADAFGANIAEDATLSQSFDAAGITQIKNGLINEVAKASDMPPPNGDADLLAVLSGRSLDANAVGALNSALTSAANRIAMSPAQTSAVTSLIAPIFAKLVQ